MTAKYINEHIDGVHKEITAIHDMTQEETLKYLQWSGALKHYKNTPSRQEVLDTLHKTLEHLYDSLDETLIYEVQS